MLPDRRRRLPHHVQSEGRLEQGAVPLLVVDLLVETNMYFFFKKGRRRRSGLDDLSPLCDSAGGDVLQRRQPRPDVRPLQQLLLQPQAVLRLPVGVRAAAQQRDRRGAEGSFCGRRRRRAGHTHTHYGSPQCFTPTCSSPQPTIVDFVNVAWWTSAAAW